MWPLQPLINNPVFHYIICGFSTEKQNQSKWNILSCDHRSILEKYITVLETIELFDFELFRFWLWPLTFRDRFIVPFESLYFSSNLSYIDIFSSISYIWLQKFRGLTLTINL